MAIACLASCGGTPRAASAPTSEAVATAHTPVRPDPDLNPEPVKKLLAIDWANTKVASDADALPSRR
jgi:hypothetical protein